MKLDICCETCKSRTAISIGYMASRFKSKLCMVLSHSPQPFDQRALTVRLHFESRVLNEHNPAAQGKIAMPACWIACCL